MLREMRKRRARAQKRMLENRRLEKMEKVEEEEKMLEMNLQEGGY